MQPYSPGLLEFVKHLVGDPQKAEITRQPLYDSLLYPTAGSAAPFSFFQVPQGAGISSSSSNAANPKGLADTNMQLAGALGQPQAFFCDGIEFDIQPGSVSTANTYTIQIPSGFATDDAATVQAGEADVNAVLSGGVLTFTVSNKAYAMEGPLFRFPPSAGFALDAAIGNVSATTAGVLVKAKMRAVGVPWEVNPGVAIAAQQPFGVTVQYPTAIATPSGFNARITCRLTGWLIRPVQ